MGLFDFFRKPGSKDVDPMLQAVRGLGRDSSVDDFLEVARSLRAEGDPVAASHALRQGIATHGDAHEIAFLRAECLLESGRKDEAIRQYQDISDGWEDDLGVQRRCGRGLIACEAWEDAEMQFHMASERFPDDAELYLIQGEAFERSGDPALAIGLYTQAWELARLDGGIRRLAAERVQRLGGETPGGAEPGRAASDSGSPDEARQADGKTLPWRLVCPRCRHVYRIGEDAVVVTTEALHDAAEFSVQLGGGGGRQPDLVGERVVGAQERAEVQATVGRIRRDLEQGRRRQWWCGRCGNDKDPHDYPWPP